MTTNEIPPRSLPGEVRAIVWRIFGAGESLLKRKSTYELIGPIIEKHIPFGNSNWIIEEIQSWFDIHGKHSYLKEEKKIMVAKMILDGVRYEHSEAAISSVAWIRNDISSTIIQSTWNPSEIDAFVEGTLRTLATLDEKDLINDPRYSIHLTEKEIRNARIKKKSIASDYSLLDMFHDINQNHIYGQYRSVRNLIALVVELRPNKFESIIERIDHPMVQAFAAHYMITVSSHGNFRMPLQWVYRGACDALIALGVLHTLQIIEHLDEDINAAKRSEEGHIHWHTELRWPEDDLQSAATTLISDLATQLKLLDPLECVRWTGELLSYAPCALRPQKGQEVSDRIKELETASVNVIAHLICTCESHKLIEKFYSALCLPRWDNWTRHMAIVARKVFDMVPKKAEQISRMVLQKHEQQILEDLKHDYPYVNKTRLVRLTEGLAASLALSREQLDLVQWVTEKCHGLPLTVWDAEENSRIFRDSDTIAKHWFHIALRAVEVREGLGYKIAPIEIREIAEILWAHCYFTGKYTGNRIDSSNEAELAAETVIQFGAPSGSWLLKHANNPKLGPRVLWGLLHGKTAQGQGKGGMQKINDGVEEVRSEIVRIATDHFKTGTQFTLAELEWWARIWILSEAIPLAQHTAKLILESQPELLDRQKKFLLLKLLILVLSEKRELDPELANYPEWLYAQLWPGFHTEQEEREDRKEIDAILGY